jgi:hypothetical protein
MILESKHLSPYVPYGLKFKVNIFDHAMAYGVMVGLNEIEIEFSGIRNTITENFTYALCSPILRPLPDLTKEELTPIGLIFREKTLETATAHDKIFAVEDAKAWLKGGMKPVLSFVQTERILSYLFSIHADVYNLIPAGLAIDINTLNNVPNDTIRH